MLRRLFSYFRCDLAIDLGTVQTRIGVAGEGLVLEEPSLVAVQGRSRQVLSGGRAVGQLARQMQGRTPDSIAVVRPLTAGAIGDFQLCEAMLRCFLAKARPPGWRVKPRVLASVPGGATAVERQALLNSLHRAGAGSVWLIAQAKAAAVGVGLPVAEPVASMLCDVGGGTTEVAVLSLGDVVAGQSVRVGGDRMDEALAAWLRRHYSLRIGPAAAERLRIELGSAWPLEEELSAEVSGADAVSGLPRKVSLTSEEVRQALADPLDEILQAIQRTLDDCGPELVADLADRGLVLCGGGALLRGLDRYLAEQSGMPVRLAAEPLTAVVRGALVCLEHRDRWQTLIDFGEE